MSQLGQAARCRLGDDQLAELDRVLDAGPAASGWEDQRWTLARIRDLVAARFKVRCTIPGTWYLLRRRGWSCQLGARRAVERDDGAAGVREKGDLAAGKRTAAALGAWIAFEDEAGQSLRPPRSRTWGRRGITRWSGCAAAAPGPKGIWSSLKRGPLANRAFTGFVHMLQVIRHGLRKIQYQPSLIEGYLAGTGLSLEPDGTDITN
jgi:hypothetical protein